MRLDDAICGRRRKPADFGDAIAFDSHVDPPPGCAASVENDRIANERTQKEPGEVARLSIIQFPADPSPRSSISVVAPS